MMHESSAGKVPPWNGCHEAKLAREARYREMLYAYLRELRQQAGLGALTLPETTPAGAA
jgi:hypothetical protein